MADFGNRLALVISKLELNTTHVGDRSGVHQTTAAKWLKLQEPKQKVWVKLDWLYAEGVNMEWLRNGGPGSPLIAGEERTDKENFNREQQFYQATTNLYERLLKTEKENAALKIEIKMLKKQVQKNQKNQG